MIEIIVFISSIVSLLMLDVFERHYKKKYNIKDKNEKRYDIDSFIYGTILFLIIIQLFKEKVGLSIFIGIYVSTMYIIKIFFIYIYKSTEEDKSFQ